MKKIIKSVSNAFLAPLNLELVGKQKQEKILSNYHHSMPKCEERLKHARSIGFTPKIIVDAGAYVGSWTYTTASIFPEAQFIVIEPNPHVEKKIDNTLQDLKGRTTIIGKAVADQPGTLPFNIWGDPNDATSASLQNHVRGSAENTVNVEVDTIDNVLTEYSRHADLVKLDLQGAELKALRGATETLKTAEMFIVEFGCLEAYIDRATPQQLMEIFYGNDYCLYDIVDCHYRPYDGAMTGGDFFFIKNDSPLRKYKGWN